ncbi:hypothetical protein J4E83_011037 [Alternaria metachromatica]|uniref:uncharacterized protein n=1 Tax=Alternaria metachromatica TaxID=283354 RepID=UPI0020C3ADC0|nr:uncharacterized protein J4E83_011037 [Alternaria metachromatica]KAI4604684.1 hypothetical protein J4E83_011037 [Alternaria metachromatica]
MADFHGFTTMAEIIGLAASLITLAGASAQLARTLLEVANVIKSAEYEARLIAADISVFSSSLTQLSMVVDLPHSKTEKLREITVVLISACRTLIEDLRMLIGEPVQHDPSRRAFTISLIRFRFRWMKVGPKVMFVKSLVDSFKTTIIVLVSTMNLAVVLQRDAPDSISESLKTQVESNIKFAEDATECLHHHRDAQQDDASSCTLTLDFSAAIEAEDATPGAGAELIVRGAAQQGITKRHDSTIFQNGEFDEDDCALQASQKCTQIVEMQQMSCALARDVLDHQSLKPTWSWNASEKMSAHEEPQPFPTSEDSYSTAGSETYERTPSKEKGGESVRHHEPQERRIPLGELLEQMRTPDSKVKWISNSSVDAGVHRQKSFERKDEEAVRDSSSRQHVSRDEKDRIDRLENLLVEKEKAEKEAAETARAKTESSKFDRLENLLISQQEAKIEKEKAKKEAAEQVEKARKAPIVFYDAIDRKFECPWRLCSNWGELDLTSD